jgi:Fe(3+) dicitrate transport protein
VRYEHEELAIDEHFVPVPRPLVHRTFRRSLPLFGLGFGNDFGRGNETYVNISQGFRPLRYLDVASPFGHTNTAANDPDPTKSLSYEAGVHGWPLKGLYYDVSVFQVNVRNRIETRATPTPSDPTATINVNTGSTRSRGIEAELHVDLLRFVGSAPDSEHFELFANASLLRAKFTASSMGLAGNTPAFAPHYLLRAGALWRSRERLKLSLNVESVAAAYFQDSNLPVGTPGAANYLPAQTPAYTVLDFAGDFKVLPHLRLLGGIANLTDRLYYARVFQNGLEPAARRTWYAGLSLEI